MSTWMPSYQSLGNHPKTKRLARALGINRPQAIGHLHYLWFWAFEYAQDGDLAEYDAEEIADAGLWDGDAETFVDALVSAGFLDQLCEGHLMIHDWWDNCWRFRVRSSFGKRMRDLVYETLPNICVACGTAEKLSVDHIIPIKRGGTNDLENLQILCKSCNSRKGTKVS